MKKSLLFISFIISCIMSLFTISGCSLGSGEFTFLENDDSYIVTSYTGKSSHVVIPSKYKNKPVDEIGSFAFQSNTNLESITIPDSINAVGVAAFRDCTSLQEVNFGNGVISIYPSAFMGCTSLTNIDLPDTVEEICAGAFQGCSNLVNISIPDSLLYLDFLALNNCASLQYNEFDNGLYLGNQDNPYSVLVSGKSSDIETIAIHDDTKTLGARSLSNTKIESIIIPENIRSINPGALSSPSLVNIEILDRDFLLYDNGIHILSEVEYNEFEGGLYLGNQDNPYLVFVTIKEGEEMSTLIIHEDTKIIACNALDSYSVGSFDFITQIKLPSNLLCIGYGAFTGCNFLEWLVIPENVEYIGVQAFSYRIKVYCCVEAKKENWKHDFFEHKPPMVECYWKGQWEYNINGNPIPLTSK